MSAKVETQLSERTKSELQVVCERRQWSLVECDEPAIWVVHLRCTLCDKTADLLLCDPCLAHRLANPVGMCRTLAREGVCDVESVTRL